MPSNISQLRAELRAVMEEISSLDKVEEMLEQTRAAEDLERAEKRAAEDANIVRKRTTADKKREACFTELLKLETVCFSVTDMVSFTDNPKTIRARIRTRQSLGSGLGTFSREFQQFLQEIPEQRDFRMPRNWEELRPSNKRAKRYSLDPDIDQHCVVNLESDASEDNYMLSESVEDAAKASASLAQDDSPVVMPTFLSELPPLEGDGAEGLPSINSMISFSRGFISSKIGGGDNGTGDCIIVGKNKKLVQIVACDEYWALQRTFHPLLPPGPGLHGAMLELRQYPELLVVDLSKEFPLFVAQDPHTWYYMGHYKEACEPRLMTIETQEVYVPKQLCRKWATNLRREKFEVRKTTVEVLMQPGLCENLDEVIKWTPERILAAMQRVCLHLFSIRIC